MPPISDLITFETAFLTLQTDFGLNYVFVGILDDFLALLAKKVKYPCLYVERPTETDDFDGNIIFSTRLFYLVPGSNLTDADKKIAYNDSRLQLRSILHYLRTENLVATNTKFTIDYKDLYSADGLIGAFSEVDIIGYGTDYNENCPKID